MLTESPANNTPPLLFAGASAGLGGGFFTFSMQRRSSPASSNMQAFLEGARNNNVRPKRAASGNLILRDGRNYRTLVNTSGRLTPAGRAWQQLTGTALSAENYDENQLPVRTGNRETIRVRGKERLARTYDPATNDWRYSRLGRRFYSEARVQYVVKVPSVHTGKRSNGNPYRREAFFPIENPINTPMVLSQAQRDDFIRSAVEALYPDGVLGEFSEERIVLNPNAAWQISEMITQPTAEGPEVTITDRALGTRPAGLSTLLFPESLCTAAFEDHDDNLCVPRQIARICGLDMEEVCCELDQCEAELYETDTWRTRGATSKMIFLYAKRNGLGACCLHGDRVVETAPGSRPLLVWAIHENHAFFYQDRRVCRQLAARVPCAFERVRREAGESTAPPFEEWLPWEGKLQPGHFWSENIEQARGQMLSLGRVPKVVLKDESQIKSLRYTFNKREAHEGACVVHALPCDWREITQWLENLKREHNVSLPYRGEGLPNMTFKVLLHLLRTKDRVYLTGEQKHALLESQEWLCAICGGKSSELEFDHVHALSTSFGEQQFQVLCRTCHAVKTHEEPREWERDVLSSHFNATVWRDYVKSDRPPPLVHRNKKVDSLEGLRIADVRRCRKRALELNVHEVPAFCPLDDVQVLNDYTLGDINYVSAPLKDCVRQLGYTGPGFQHRCLTEWLLYAGQITWADVPYKITATGRLPADIFKQPLAIMEQAWTNGLGKQSVNAMIGTWCLDECFSFKLVSSNHEGDAPANSLKRVFHFEGGHVIDYVQKSRLVSFASMRPLHDLCMCMEAVRVGQMLFCLRKQKAPIFELKTDSVLYRPGARTRFALASLTFLDLHVRDIFEKAGQRRIDEYCTLPVVNSAEQVFRDDAATEKDPLKVDPKGPQRNVRYVHAPPVWRDLTEAQAEQAIVNGQNLLVLGIAGTGKTTICKRFVELLRALQMKVNIIAKTHTASQRAGGVTVDHYVRRHILHGACVADAIWADELFQIETTLWAQLQKLSGRQWLLSGDENQFGALFDNWKGSVVPQNALLNSCFLHQLSGGNRLVLRECRRSEHELFQWYRSLIVGGSRFETPLSHVLAEARQRFHFDGPARYNLCISHRRRIRLNAECNRHFKPAEGAVFIRCKPEKGQLCAAQNLFVWPGIELLGCSRCGKRVRNNVVYTVKGIDEEHVKISAEGEGDAGTLTLTYQQIAELTRLSFARTYASCQGTEFDSTLRLHDVNSRFFTRKHLFVALSRAKQANQIDIATA